MKIKLIFILFFTITFSILSFKSIHNNSASANNQLMIKNTLKIILVHSYTHDHICTGPQRNGILETLKQLRFSYKLAIKEMYMETKVKNTTPEHINNITNFILNEIKDFNPDFIFTTDDDAFEYIAQPLLKHGYKIISSGINKPFSEYESEGLTLNSLIFIQETIVLDRFFTFLEKGHFQPNKFYILYDKTSTSYYMLNNFQNQLQGKYSFDSYKLETTSQLKKILEEISKAPPGVIVVALQRLWDENFNNGIGGYIDKVQLFEYFKKYNKTHIELTANVLFSSFGYSISCGPDFYGMSELGVNYLIKNNLTIPDKNNVILTPMKLTINSSRLKQLGFSDMLYTTHMLVDNIYTSGDK